MNGFPFASSSFHKLVELQIHRIYLEHFPTQLPLSLDMIFISGTKRIVSFFRMENVKEPNNPKTKKPRWNSNLFHTNGPSWTYYIVACGHKAIVVMWTQSHCGGACKTWCVALYHLKVSLISEDFALMTPRTGFWDQAHTSLHLTPQSLFMRVEFLSFWPIWRNDGKHNMNLGNTLGFSKALLSSFESPIEGRSSCKSWFPLFM